MIHGYHEHEHNYHMFCKYKLGRWCQMGVSVVDFEFCHKGCFILVNDFNIKKPMDLKKIMEAYDFISKHLVKPSQF